MKSQMQNLTDISGNKNIKVTNREIAKRRSGKSFNLILKKFGRMRKWRYLTMIKTSKFSKRERAKRARGNLSKFLESLFLVDANSPILMETRRKITFSERAEISNPFSTGNR